VLEATDNDFLIEGSIKQRMKTMHKKTNLGLFGQDGVSDGVWGPGFQQGLCMSNPSSDDVPQNL
jgi:hypothetical protein